MIDLRSPQLYERFKKIMSSPLLLIICCFLYPTSYFLQINSHIYRTDQIVVTVMFILLLSILIALVGGLFISFILRIISLVAKNFINIDVNSASSKLYRAILCGFGTIILLVLLLINIHAFISDNFLFVGFCLLLALGIPVLSYHFEIIRYFNLLLCALIVFNCFVGVFYVFSDASMRPDSQEIDQKVLFKQKPNVYLVLLESYASLDIRKKIYSIDNTPLIKSLIDNKYDIYKTYACYNSTLPSLASVLRMNHHYYIQSRGLADGAGYRKIIGGVINNHVMNIFLNNGYRIDYSKFPSSLYHPSPAVNGDIQPLLQPIEVFYGFFAIAHKLLNYPLTSTESFKTLIQLPDKILGVPQKLANKNKLQNDVRPVFSLIYHGGVPHTYSFFSEYPTDIRNLSGARQMPLMKLNRINNYWINIYKNSVLKADAALIELIRSFAEKDPKAIVILVGDHGTNLNRNCWIGKNDDPNENILANGIQPTESTRDIFEVFMAIKWPSGTKKPTEYFSHVNIFRQLFAVLSEDQAILKTKASNDSFMRSTYLFTKTKGVFRTVKEGKVLERWVTFPLRIEPLQTE